MGLGAAVDVAEGQHEHGGREAVTAQMGDLPGALDSGGGQFGGERPAEERAAAVALAVGADEREGAPVWGRPRRAVPKVRWSPLPRAVRSRSSSCSGSVVVALCSHTFPGTVWATYTRRSRTSRQSAWRPGRRMSATRTPVPSAAVSRARPIAGSRWLDVSALTPQGPGCSSSSHVLAVAAVPARGSPRCRDAEVHVLTEVSLT